MGMLSKLAGALKLKKEKMTILVIGLNNSGKTTIINYFKSSNEQSAITVPTIGFNIEQFQNHGVSISAIDMSGVGRYRNLWEHQFKNCHGIVYVIDSNDRMRLVVVKDELDTLLSHPDMEKRLIPILFFSNKMDFQDSLTGPKIAAALNLESIKDKPWHISLSNAITGEGLEEGVQWLIQHMRLSILHNDKKSKKKSERKT